MSSLEERATKAIRDRLLEESQPESYHCYGCGEQVPAAVAHRGGSIRPFHWNDQGGGHTCCADAYTEDERVGAGGGGAVNGFITTPTMADVERLERRIAELEQRLESHGHSYAACYGPGGEWDVTGPPRAAKERG